MKKTILSLLVMLAVLAVVGCTTTIPYDVTNNSVGSKVGEASGTFYFWTWKGDFDWSLQTAAKNAGISKIATVDLREKRFIIGRTYTTIVTGE
jgi:ABC-type glycerol-3-phosphate transport system substrate-binding protein